MNSKQSIPPFLTQQPSQKGEQQMEFLTNPWFILFTVLNIVAMIYLAIKFYYKTKNEPTLLEKLRASGIHPTLRKPPDIKREDTSNTQNNNP